MSDSGVAEGLDRLPWLSDDLHRSPRPSMPPLWRWSFPILLLVALGSYWLGMRSGRSEELTVPMAEAPLAVTEVLPEPREAVAQVPVAARPAELPRVRQGRAVTRSAVPAKPKATPPRRSAKAAPQSRYWPARNSGSAAGRMVRIGTFETSLQAKQGWRAVVGIYPGMKPIPAVVVPGRSLRDGRTYYRLQMGTNSQAHSEVLCQWMRSIGQSCVVVGLRGAQS